MVVILEVPASDQTQIKPTSSPHETHKKRTSRVCLICVSCAFHVCLNFVFSQADDDRIPVLSNCNSALLVNALMTTIYFS